MKKMYKLLLWGTVSVLLILFASLLAYILFDVNAEAPTLPTFIHLETNAVQMGEAASYARDSDTQSIAESTSVAIPVQGIPLSSIPLSDTQKSALSTAGINVETFVITDGMAVCVEAKLGIERTYEIFEGDAPGILEGLSILGCAKE